MTTLNKRLILICTTGLFLITATATWADNWDGFDFPSLKEVEQQLVERAARVKAFQADVVTEMPAYDSTIGFPLSPDQARHTMPTIYEGRYTYVRTENRVRTRLDLSPAEPSLADTESVSEDDYLDQGYVAAKTDFALGHLVHGIASKALGRTDEASDHFHEAAQIDIQLKGLVEVLKSDHYNTVLIVGAGLGPRKLAYGPDNAMVRFVPTPGSESTANTLAYRVNGSDTQTVPLVCDVNRMAMDHMWNNLEDVRLAKSVIGRQVMEVGAQMARSGDMYSAMIGLGVQAAGAAIRAGAAADTRYCEAMPQRIYLVPLHVTVPDTTVELGVRGFAGSRLVLPALAPPPHGVPLAVHYVRLPHAQHAPAWATGTHVLYGNDKCDSRVEGDDLPFILGGRCVRRPTEEVLAHYRRAGNLADMSLTELEDLYRAEGIRLTLQEEEDRAGLHILEGGNSMETPVVGSAGYKRLFFQEHSPHVPRSPVVQELAERIQAERGIVADVVVNE